VVHHLIINKLYPLFEKEFISDSYACRVGKGTHYGIKTRGAYNVGWSKMGRIDLDFKKEMLQFLK